MNGLRPTGSGIGVVLGSAVFLCAGLTTGWAEFTWFGTAGLLVAGAALVLVLLADRGINATREVAPRRVSVGTPAASHILFGRTPGRVVPTEVTDHIDNTPIPVQVQHSATMTLALPTDRRGLLAVGPLLATRIDPLGLVRRVSELDGTQELIVHPRIWPVLRDPSSALRDMDGPTVEQQITGSDTFDRLREYTPGDEPRFVHWPATAHTGTLMVRHFVDTARPDVGIVFDDTAGAHGSAEGFEAALEVVASLALAANASEAPVQLLSFGGLRSSVARGDSPVPLLDALAGATLLTDAAPELETVQEPPVGHAYLLVTGTGPRAGESAARHLARLDLIPVTRDAIVVGNGQNPSLHPGCRVVGGASAFDALTVWSAVAS